MVCLSPARYAELHALSNFSFQRGASSAQELFERAARLDYSALAITDECSLAGIVRALEASEKTGVALIVGTEVQLVNGPKLVLLATDQDAYSDICKLITTGRRRSIKGEYLLTRADVEILGAGVLVLWVPAGSDFGGKDASRTEANGTAHPASSGETRRRWVPAFAGTTMSGNSSQECLEKLPDAVPTSRENEPVAAWIVEHFAGRVWIAVELHRGPDDAARLAMLGDLGKRHKLPLVAAGDVHMHARGRRALQDALTAIRLGCTIAEAGHGLFPNGERHLRRIEDLETIYPADLLTESLHIAARCTFKLRDISYVYPHELVPADTIPIDHLRQLTMIGAHRRWPSGIQERIHRQIEHELSLIAQLEYEHFFLTVADIVTWAREQKPPILCQGRGSSANSAVCYCLGITAVDPEHGRLLFERFLSIERKEPPDIDVDFEHERREEVIQYVFRKYGRTRAALAATVISYRGKSAARDIGRVLGLAEDQLDQLSHAYSHAHGDLPIEERLRERGFDPASKIMLQLIALVRQLKGFPRHLSQHVGGFVISEHPLHTLVPVENASMAERTIIQWDKDDLESLKLLKVDCLALGMLTCLRKCFDLLRVHRLADLDLASVPQDDEQTYAMIRAADTIGVFQIESRAQMSMLPRLRPETFYDLVVQIAIVRPGPIQGGMVHPYLRRRQGKEDIDYPQSRDEKNSGSQASRVQDVLERTLGVPIFQEQVMKLVEVVAGFTPGRADALRRAMAAWKRKGGLEPFHDEIRNGMLDRGYEESYFERIFEQIKGFGDYGFPESHSASFALLAYASSWLKCHHPAAFTCALLNSLPMGFYGPAQLIRDALHHGVRVLPVDVTVSEWDCALEDISTIPFTVVPAQAGTQRLQALQTLASDLTRFAVGCCRNDDKKSIAPEGAPTDTSDASEESDTSEASEVHEASTREPGQSLALRLGFSRIAGLSESLARRIVNARNERPFRDVADLVNRAGLNTGDRARLADADALRSLSGHRHQARWDSAGAEPLTPMLVDAPVHEESISLSAPALRTDVMSDYASQGFTLRRHPLALVRDVLSRERMLRARDVHGSKHGRRVRCAGLITVRQRPGTAKGVTFVTIEDETGIINIVVWQALAESQRRVLLDSVVLGVEGVLQSSEGVRHVIAHRLINFDALLPELGSQSRDFH
jgi:error-prone DNA polymerase